MMPRRKPYPSDLARINGSSIGELALPDETHISEADLVLPAEPDERRTLAIILDDLIAYQDTLAMAQSDEDRLAISTEIAEQQAQLIAKVDRYAAVMRRLEYEAQWEKAEADRHSKRRARYLAALSQMHDYAIAAMQAQNVRKLDGQGATLKLRQSPGAVLITDEESVPGSHKTVTVTMPLLDWEMLIATITDYSIDCKAHISTSKDSIKRAIKRGEEVAGADLVFPDSLQLE